MMGNVVIGKVLVGGTAVSAEVLLLAEPLSLWGGLDPDSGRIIDQRHPQVGQIVTQKALVLPAGRGSSSASSILLEAIRSGTAPAAIITSEIDGILALGAAVGRELYDQSPPVLVVAAPDYGRFAAGQQVTIAPNGRISIETSS